MPRATQSDTLRAPDWRYLRALDLLYDGGGPSRHDDAWTVGLFQVLRTPGRRAARRWPDLAAAHAVATGEPHVRWAVEARVLAGEPPDAIACKHGMRPGAVEAFERLHFDVRDRRAGIDWVAQAVIRRDPSKALGEQEPRVLMYFVGYFAGPAVLDALLGGGDAIGQADLARFLAEDGLWTARRNLAIAARALPADAETVERLLRLTASGSTGAAGGDVPRAAGVVLRQAGEMLLGEPRPSSLTGVPLRAA